MVDVQPSKIAGLAHRENVVLMYLFGSAARGDMHATSDLDIAIQTKNPITLGGRTRIQRDLKNIFAAEHREIDLVDLRHINPLLAREIIESGVRLFGSPSADDLFYRTTMKRYVDAQQMRQADEDYLKTYAPV